ENANEFGMLNFESSFLQNFTAQGFFRMFSIFHKTSRKHPRACERLSNALHQQHRIRTGDYGRYRSSNARVICPITSVAVLASLHLLNSCRKPNSTKRAESVASSPWRNSISSLVRRSKLPYDRACRWVSEGARSRKRSGSKHHRWRCLVGIL